MNRLLSFRLTCLASLVLALQGVGGSLYSGEADNAESSLFEEALSISKQLDPETDLAKCREVWTVRLDVLRSALAVRKEKKGRALSAVETIEVLNRFVLVNRNVAYISNKYWRDSLFTSALLNNRGNCLSTSLFYYLLACELKLPITLAFAPRHAFVRWADGQHVLNIETTDNGKIRTDETLKKNYQLCDEDRKQNGFLVTLTRRQIRSALRNNWSSIFYSLEKRERAWDLLRKARAGWPENTHFSLTEASFLMREGNISKAEKILVMFKEKATGPWARSQAAVSYSTWLQSQGRSKEAIAWLEPCLEDAPQGMKLNIINRLGTLFRHTRDFEKAIKIHRLHAQIEPGEDSYNQLGSVLTEAHRDKDAIEAYQKALHCNPENFFTKVILAGLYERSGDKEKGRAYFAKIEKPRARLVTWYCALVWYYANIKEEQLMLENMKAALALDRSGHTYHYFVREPDLDPYRQNAAFVDCMNQFKPPAPKPNPKLEINEKTNRSVRKTPAAVE